MKRYLVILFIILLLIGCFNNKKAEKYASGSIIIVKPIDDNKSTVTNKDITITKDDFNSVNNIMNIDIYNKIKEKYKNVNKVDIKAINQTYLLQVSYSCIKLSDDECLEILNNYFNYISDYSDINYSFSIIDNPVIISGDSNG